MPNTSAAKKALRNSRRKELLNKSRKHNIRQALKDLRKVLVQNPKNYQESLSKVFSTLDKAVKTNVIPKARANRKKARTNAIVKQALDAVPATPTKTTSSKKTTVKTKTTLAKKTAKSPAKSK